MATYMNVATRPGQLQRSPTVSKEGMEQPETTSKATILYHSSSQIDENAVDPGNWKTWEPVDRVFWDYMASENMENTHLAKGSYPENRSGITKSRSRGILDQASLATTGGLISLGIVLISIFQLIKSVVPCFAWSSWEDVDPSAFIDVLLKATLVLMGIIGGLCCRYNYKLSKLMTGSSTPAVPENSDYQRELRNKWLQQLSNSEFQTNVRVNGPRYLLIGISVFFVNDLIGVASEWINVIIVRFGNPNYPNSPPDERPEITTNWILIIQTVSYLLALFVMIKWVYGWLLSWWEILRVGFTSYKEVQFNGWSSKEMQDRADTMRKVIFTTGFESKNCWELGMIQLDKKYRFQQNLRNSPVTPVDDQIEEMVMESAYHNPGHEARGVTNEEVRDVIAAALVYNETIVRISNMNGATRMYAATSSNCDRISQQHANHNRGMKGHHLTGHGRRTVVVHSKNMLSAIQKSYQGGYKVESSNKESPSEKSSSDRFGSVSSKPYYRDPTVETLLSSTTSNDDRLQLRME